MPDSQYLSIGEVLGLLLEDFPDVTISKIRFLESQGLIEPERTPSGYRKFYDHDVDLLRAILHEQRENFLPLKVIRDRISSGSFEADPTGGRTPPRGIRNVEVHNDTGAESTPAATTVATAATAMASEHRDSVFRRTDGGPEWADGRALIPGAQHQPATVDGTAATTISATPAPADSPPTAALPTSAPVATTPPASAPVVGASVAGAPAIGTAAAGAPAVATPPAVTTPSAVVAPTPPPSRPPAATTVTTSPTGSTNAAEPDPTMPYSRDEFCAAAELTSAQLDELESYGLVTPRGTGRDAAYPPETLEIARISGRFLANGIDARHLRSWRQSADREAALFEQRIMPLLRQRNPASRQRARDTLAELAGLGARLHDALIEASLRHHFDNG